MTGELAEDFSGADIWFLVADIRVSIIRVFPVP